MHKIIKYIGLSMGMIHWNGAAKKNDSDENLTGNMV